MWKKYFKKQEKRKAREQIVRAVSLCNDKNHALDLGSGNFIESKFLIKQKFKKIIAVDNSKDLKKYTKNLNKKIKFENISFQEYDYPKKTFDLINAQFSLPFYGKKDFFSFTKKVTKSLKPKGIFVGQFFGNKDSFNTKKYKNRLAFQTKKEVLDILSGFKILEFMEEEKDGKTVSGKQRHWHVFHFIAKKR